MRLNYRAEIWCILFREILRKGVQFKLLIKFSNLAANHSVYFENILEILNGVREKCLHFSIDVKDSSEMRAKRFQMALTRTIIDALLVVFYNT